MTTYTRTFGPGGNFTSLAVWQSNRLGARGGDAPLVPGDVEELVLLNQTSADSITWSTSWPAGVTIRVRGQNSHLGDWSVTAQGARLEATSFNSLFIWSGVYNSGLVFEFANFVAAAHASTAGRGPFVCDSGGITIRWDKALVTGGNVTGTSAFYGGANSAVTTLEMTKSVFTRGDANTSDAVRFNWSTSYYNLTARGCFIRDIYAHQASPGAVNLTLYTTLMELAASPNGSAKNATDCICTAAWSGWTTTNCDVGAFVTGVPASGQVGFADKGALNYALYDDANNLAIDFATNEATLTEDILGAPRPARGGHDAGPFELQLEITDAPEAPSDLAGTALTTSSIALTWTDNAAGSSAEASFEVQYRVAGSSGAWTVADDEIAADATGYNLTGLAAGSYEVRVRAANSIGTSAWSGTATVSTRAYKAADAKAVGCNIGGINYYMPEHPWKDIILSMGAWQDQNPDYTPVGTTDVDENNNLQSMAGARVRGMLTSTLGSGYPGVQWVLLYDGDGLGRFNIGNSTTVSSVQGRHVFTMGSGNVWIDITSINAADKMRNLRCVRVSDEATFESDPWRQEFLDQWTALRCLRFGHWTIIGDAATWPSDWAGRASMTYRGMSPHGPVPYERIIDLCERVDCDAWVCIPHTVTDDYVEQMATLFRDTFPAGRKIYIEYSNECWNPIFAQYDYCYDQAGLSADPHVSALYALNTYAAQAMWYGLRTKEVMDIWSEVFAGQEHRIVRVLAGQSVGPFTDNAMDYPGVVDSIDAVSLAPYVGDALSSVPGIESETNEAILSMLDGELTTKLAVRTQALVDNYREVYGLRVIAYEGGQHMTPPGAGAIHTKFLDVNRDAGMRDFVYNNLAAWHAVSDDLFVWYQTTSAYSIYGYWGLRESDTQDRTMAPKLDGLLDYIEDNAVVSSYRQPSGIRMGMRMGL